MCLCLKCIFCLKVGRQITIISHHLLNKIVASKQPTLAIFKSSHSVSMAFPFRIYLPLRKNTKIKDIWETERRTEWFIRRVMAPVELFFVSQHNLICNPVCSKNSVKCYFTPCLHGKNVLWSPNAEERNTVVHASDCTSFFMKNHVTANNNSNRPQNHCSLSLLWQTSTCLGCDMPSLDGPQLS